VDPENVRGSPIELTWAAPRTGGPVSSYGVVRDGTDIAVLTAPANAYVDPAYDRAAHAYYVRAQGTGGATPSSRVVLPAAPGAPQRVAARLVDKGGAALQWAAPGSGGPRNAYAVLRDGIELARLDPRDTGYVDTAWNDTVRYYQIRAFGPGGIATSDPVSVTAAPAPAAPLYVTTQLDRDCGLRVRWVTSTAGGPRTAYAVLQDGAVIVRLPADATSYLDHDARARPQYRVRAIGPGGSTTSRPATHPGLGICLGLGPPAPDPVGRPALEPVPRVDRPRLAIARLTGPVPAVVHVGEPPPPLVDLPVLPFLGGFVLVPPLWIVRTSRRPRR
jgi:hypothetical protein